MHPNLFLEAVSLWASHWTRHFLKLCQKPVETHEKALMTKLRRNQDSDFGRKHHFADVRSVSDFRANVPVSDYEYVRPYIDRCIAGETTALFGDKTRIHMYALTSGTHSQPKHIPVTTEFLDEYQKGWRVWGACTHRDHPTAFRRRMLQITSSWHEEYTALEVPCGSISGLNAQMQPRLFRTRYLPGLVLFDVTDARAKCYLTARLTLGRRVSMICTANPSSVLSVVRYADQNAQELIRDIRDGTLRNDLDVPNEVRSRLRRRLRRDPDTAKRLEDILTRTGRLRPMDYWPDLAVVSNWKGGTVGLYLRDYPEYFGALPIRDIGLLATEGRLSISLSSEGAGGVLDIAGTFFEFIPLEQFDRPQPETRLIDEVEVGKCYGLVITTSCGLYRYNIGDIVRVDGFEGKTPVVTFLNKGVHVSSLTGEKLTEHQVVEALALLGKQVESLPDLLVLSPVWGAPPRYALTVESDSAARVDWSKALNLLDEHLGNLNIEYRSRRDSGRLGLPTVHSIPPGSFARMKEEHLRSVGGRREQYKHVYLVPDVDFCQRFRKTNAV